MRFADTLRGLLRRWYIVLPGLIITASIVVGVWFAIPPGYYRSATQLLIPGVGNMPEGANPYLFLGGLAPAADVLVRAIGSENVLDEMSEEHPGVEITIRRDTTTAGPIILISVTASSDADAEAVLEQLVDRTATVLEDFQRAERVPTGSRMTVIPITVDNQSELQERSRMLGATGAAIGGIVLTLFIAGLVDGFGQRERREASELSGDSEPERNYAVGNDIAPEPT